MSASYVVRVLVEVSTVFCGYTTAGDILKKYIECYISKDTKDMQTRRTRKLNALPLTPSNASLTSLPSNIQINCNATWRTARVIKIWHFSG